MAKHGLAIIGLGMAVAPHAKSLRDLADRVDVVGAYSPSEARRTKFAEQYKFPLSSDLDALLADPKIGTVLLLTPPNTHLDLVKKAVAAGKHVLLEKPVEITTARAEELVSVAEKAGKTIGLVLQHRFKPSSQAFRKILDSGALGKMVSCSTTARVWRPQSYYDQPGRGTKARDGGGVLLTQGIHTLDLMLSFVPPVEQVFAYATTTSVHKMETEDLVCGAMKFKGGIIGTIDASTAAYPGFAEKIDFICEKGTASLCGTELVVAYHDGRTEKHGDADAGGGAGADPMAFPHDYHRSLIVDFFDALDEKRAPGISGREALRVHHLIDALLASAASGKPESPKG